MTDGNYRKCDVHVHVNAFKWDGNINNIPPWVTKSGARSMTFNDATNPPGLVLDTIAHGTIHIPYEHWFVCNVRTNFAFTRTDEAFKQEYEPNT